MSIVHCTLEIKSYENQKLICFFAIFALSSCSQAAEKPNTSSTSTTEAKTTTTAEIITYEIPTFYEIKYEDVDNFDVTDPNIPDPIEFGNDYAKYYCERVKDYFGFDGGREWSRRIRNVYVDGYNWEICLDPDSIEGKAVFDDSGIPISYASGRKYIIDKLNLTEKCFDSLCETAPTTYREIDGALSVAGTEGGDAGWIGSEIADYERTGDVITYKCFRKVEPLLKEQYGEADEPFTFSLAYTDGKWRLDELSYVEGFGGFRLE